MTPLIKYSSSDFSEIMEMLDKRMNDKGKNWRHVLKSLKVLDYCLHEGSEMVVTWARKNIYIIKTLREFIYMDEEGRDVGQNGMLDSPVYPRQSIISYSSGFCQRTHVAHSRRGSSTRRTTRSKTVEDTSHWIGRRPYRRLCRWICAEPATGKSACTHESLYRR